MLLILRGGARCPLCPSPSHPFGSTTHSLAHQCLYTHQTHRNVDPVSENFKLQAGLLLPGLLSELKDIGRRKVGGEEEE